MAAKKKRKHTNKTYGKRLARSAAMAHKQRHKKKAKKRRKGLTPIEVIATRARTLKRNKRAAAVYRKVLGC
jgi:hypothetical protein